MTLDKILQIKVLQDNRSLPLQLHYDRALWGGLSWAAVEVHRRDLQPNSPIHILCSSFENAPVQLTAEVYSVNY